MYFTHCVDEQSTLLWFLSFNLLFNHAIIHVFAKLHKLVPLYRCIIFFFCSWLQSLKYNSTYVIDIVIGLTQLSFVLHNGLQVRKAISHLHLITLVNSIVNYWLDFFNLKNLIQLFLVFYDNDIRFTIFKNKLASVRSISGVYTSR